MVYQYQELKKYLEGLRYFQNHHKEYCTKVIECICSCIAWSDLELMRDIVFVLRTQGWEKAVEENDSMEAITRLTERFAIPLEDTAADVGQIAFEFDAVLHYAIQFIFLSTLNYKAVWWRIFHSPSAGEWCNILILVKILFSLPASNGKLERVFSQVNLIKSEKRTLLSNETLNDLLVLTSDQTPLNEYSPDNAIDLWWSDKSRRPNQRKRKAYKK
uniref:HAT C-terminal dimerisation domain-containing protein n=1 Tax=Amphimedon queenslandica TaxID=400682 RepID=A0A1X7V1N3_AMPQE